MRVEERAAFAGTFGAAKGAPESLRIRRNLRGVGFVDGPRGAGVDERKALQPRAELRVASQAIIFN